MKALTLFLSFLFAWQAQSQHVIKGTVTDSYNEPIPGVRVYIANTTYGVITDFKGFYFLELPTIKSYDIAFKMIGMQDTIVQIKTQRAPVNFNVSLKSVAVKLDAVEVYADKVDIARKVIKAVQDNRKNMAFQFDNYTCETYLKTSLEKEKRQIVPFFGGKIKEDTNKVIKMNLIESLAISKFVAPDIYHESIIAHHDYSDKSGNIPAATPTSFLDIEPLRPVQAVMVNPYIFFEKVEDGDFNLYQNMLNLPKISEHPITSPIGIQAFLNYKFNLKDILFEDGHKIYEIEVTPKFSAAPLLSGSLFIIDELWVIKSFELNVNSSAMPFFLDFTVIHNYDQIDSFWVPTRREYVYTVNDEDYQISANTRVNHQNYEFNTNISEKTFKNEVMNYQPDAFDKDSSYWNKIRPIQLKLNELDYIIAQTKIEDYQASEQYLDSVDAAYNKITFWDVTLNGIGFRNRFRKQEFYIDPIISGLKILGVGGFRYGIGGFYSKKFDNGHQIKVSPTLDYGFRNKDLKGRLGVDYTFLPRRFGMISVEAGDVYELITTETSLINLFGRNNYVRNTFGSIAYRQELVNGFYAKVEFSFSDRQSISSLQLASWTDKLVEFTAEDTTTARFFENFNQPVDFERYKVSMIEFRLQYRFKQKYIIKGNEKQIIGTAYPEIELTYSKGIPNLFDSEVNFDFLELEVHDEINLGNYGDSKWRFIAGSFVNKVDLRFIENKFFRGSEFSVLTNPMQTHQTLDSTFFTSAPYLQAFYMHNFNGFLLNKIPFINTLKLETTAGASALIIQELNYNHAEFFVGVSRNFKVKNQLLKFGVYYAGRLNNETSALFTFKIGLDYFNTFTNSWSY